MLGNFSKYIRPCSNHYNIDIPGFRLHPLKGEGQGHWSISVNGNWRLTFEFQDGNAYILDYEDYH